jgi:hypothetical protein
MQGLGLLSYCALLLLQKIDIHPCEDLQKNTITSVEPDEADETV